jgi:glycosyltransferase involved in cell wall biosynthesis
MTADRVSVIIPVFDQAVYLDEALASVAEQTRPVDEVIVVDDGSSDDSAERAERSGAHVVRLGTNVGPGAARNRGLEVATGTLICFADADDVLLAHKVAAQLAHLAADPELGIVMARHELLVEPGAEHLVRRSRDPVFGDLGGVEPLSASLVRREVLDRVGPLDEGLRHGEGLDWVSRAARAGVRSDVHPEPLYRRRIHQTNASHDQDRMQQDAVALLRRRIAERRDQ